MDIDRHKEEILNLYEVTRRGHLEGDAAKLLAQYGHAWDDLRDGTVVGRMIEEELQRTEGFLAETSYLEWDDVRPPQVEVSSDATMAWLLAEIRARAIQTRPDGSSRQISYQCAWLQVYERTEEGWVAVVNAPSVKLDPETP